MQYKVKAGETIAHITKQLGTDWQTLKKHNPEAIGQSQTSGNWFVKAGTTVAIPSKFETMLQEQSAQTSANLPLPSTSLSLQAPPDTAPAQSTPSTTTLHKLQKGETIWGLAVKKYKVSPKDILALNNIRDPTSLQIGQVIKIPASSSGSKPKAVTQTKGESTEVTASWYGSYHHGRTMANGAPFNMYGNTIAHKKIPLGTQVELENPETGEKATAVVTDRGPYVAGRDIDLSYGLAKRLSLVQQGVGNLRMRVL